MKIKESHYSLIIVLTITLVAIIGLTSNSMTSKTNTIGGKAIVTPEIQTHCHKEKVCVEKKTIEKTELECLENGIKYYNVCIGYDTSNGELKCSKWIKDTEQVCKQWDVLAKEANICIKYDIKDICK